MLEHSRAGCQARSSTRALGCLEQSMLERSCLICSSMLVCNTTQPSQYTPRKSAQYTRAQPPKYSANGYCLPQGDFTPNASPGPPRLHNSRTPGRRGAPPLAVSRDLWQRAHCQCSPPRTEPQASTAVAPRHSVAARPTGNCKHV